MKSQVLGTLWCNISGEAAGEILNWPLLGVKGSSFRTIFSVTSRIRSWLDSSITRHRVSRYYKLQYHRDIFFHENVLPCFGVLTCKISFLVFFRRNHLLNSLMIPSRINTTITREKLMLRSCKGFVLTCLMSCPQRCNSTIRSSCRTRTGIKMKKGSGMAWSEISYGRLVVVLILATTIHLSNQSPVHSPIHPSPPPSLYPFIHPSLLPSIYPSIHTYLQPCICLCIYTNVSVYIWTIYVYICVYEQC